MSPASDPGYELWWDGFEWSYSYEAPDEFSSVEDDAVMWPPGWEQSDGN